MMVVHVLPEADGHGETTVPYLIAGGRSAAAFAVMAGVGLALATGGATPHRPGALRGDRAGIAVRAVAIGLIGLALGYPDSGVAVILAYYAVLFALALPLLGLRAGPCFMLAGLLAVGMPVLSALVRPGLTPLDYGNPTYADLFGDPGRLLGTLAFTGYYPALSWMAYLCAGLAAGRLVVSSERVAGALLCGGAALALTASGLSAYLLGPAGGLGVLARSSGRTPEELGVILERSQFGNVPTDTWWWMAVDAPHSTTPLDLLHTIGTSLALLGAMLLVARIVPRLVTPLAAAGSMTLSLYSAHVLLLGSGRLPEDPVRSWLLQVVLALALATVWRARWTRGPLESGVAVLAGRARSAVTPLASTAGGVTRAGRCRVQRTRPADQRLVQIFALTTSVRGLDACQILPPPA
jgi:hypothetical protein